MTSKPFYPEESLEAHGLTPDTFDSAGCYALSLELPDTARIFVNRWQEQYDVDPPDELMGAVIDRVPLIYVGATGNLRDRLHDHVAGDVRRVRLLAVCPPTGVVAVWRYDSFDAAETHERRHAYALRDERPGVGAWCNGGLV